MNNLAFIKDHGAIPEADRRMAFDVIREKSFRAGEEFTLASGRKSNVYFNMKGSMLDPRGAHHFALMVLELLPEIGCDAIGGLELGAVPLISSAAALSYNYQPNLKTFIVRKEAKKHGTRELIEGPNIDELRKCSVAVVDDVTTTGGSTLQAVKVLRNLEIKVKHAITIVDREEGASEAFAAAGITLHPLFLKSEFVDDIKPG